MNKIGDKLAFILSVLTVGLIGYGIFYFVKNGGFGMGESKIPEGTPETQTEFLNQTNTPTHFPSDLPIESDAIVYKNQVDIRGGGFQRFEIKAYYSKKNITELYEDYRKYFIDGGYKIISEMNDKDVKTIQVYEKGSFRSSFIVSVFNNSLTKDVHVEIMWIDDITKKTIQIN